MKENTKLKIGITIGDMNGIGPEIILKTFQDNRMLDFCTPIIYASVKSLEFISKQLNHEASFNQISTAVEANPNKINIISCWKDEPKINFGIKDKNIGRYAIMSLKEATKDLKNKLIDAMVTAPINKNCVQSDEFSFPGHTEYLDKELSGEPLMLMVSNNLRVGLLTDHIPINKISEHITKELIEQKLKIIQKTLVEDFNISKPKIAMLGLNPHSGDGGVIGKEEENVIIPVIEELKEKEMLIFGPYSADGFFGSNKNESFDAVLATYHDQGLIPFKTLSFGQGVNYTAGLDRIRTSPDHGTAYEITGKGIADETSFKEALFLAITIYRNRKEHQELIKGAIKEEKLIKTK